MGVIYYMFVSENSNLHHEEESKPVEMFVVLRVCMCVCAEAEQGSM